MLLGESWAEGLCDKGELEGEGTRSGQRKTCMISHEGMGWNAWEERLLARFDKGVVFWCAGDLWEGAFCRLTDLHLNIDRYIKRRETRG